MKTLSQLLRGTILLMCLSQITVAQQQGNAVISGTVLRADSGEPLSGVSVTALQIRAEQLDTMTAAAAAGITVNQFLAATGGTPGGAGAGPPRNLPPLPLQPVVVNTAPSAPPINRTVTTDAQGRFLISDLVAGSYQIYGEKDGFARQDYGQPPGGGAPARPIAVAAREERANILLRMTQTGSISGRISDASGNPAIGVPVQIVRPAYMESGFHRFQTFVPPAITNDRGEYRLFWIVPGTYYIVAGDDTHILTPAPPSMFQSEEIGLSPNRVPEDGFGVTFYPGETDFADASPLEVHAGDDLNGIDFRATPRQVHSIRGRLLDTKTGRPPTVRPAIQVAASRLYGGSTEGGSQGVTYDPASGEFEQAGVFPGNYELRFPSGGIVRARLPIEMLGADLDVGTVRLMDPSQLNGRIRLEGLAAIPQELQHLRVQLTPIFSTNRTPDDQVTSTEMNVSGAVTLNGVLNGMQRVGVLGLPPSFYVKEIRYRDADVLNMPLSYDGPGADVLDILISPKAGRISGTVISADTSGTSVQNVQVVLVPDEEQRRRIDLFKQVLTDSNGHFEMGGIAPGSYKLFAWQSLEQYFYFDAVVLKRDEPLAQPVQITESSSQTFRLRIIPK